MPHVFEQAPTSRSKCRGCRQPIERGEWRFGERLPNPFAEGEMTHWFHPLCAAYKRPEAITEALASAPQEMPNRDVLDAAAKHSLAHRRLPRIDGAERSPSGQARCRQCREPIERGTLRIRLTFYEEGTFAPGGFVHAGCSGAYFETTDILDQVMHFSRELAADDREELKGALL